MKVERSLAAALLLVGAGAASANILTNGSFETPELNGGQRFNGTAWSAGDGSSGYSSTNIPGWLAQTVNWGNGNSWFFYGSQWYGAAEGDQCISMQNVQLWQSTGVQMHEGSKYTLSGYAYYSSNATSANNAYFRFYAVDDSSVIEPHWTTLIQATTLAGDAGVNVWTATPNISLVYTATAADEGKYLVFGALEYSPAASSGALQVDNFSIEVANVPEPAALGLFAISAFGAFLRRKS